MKIEDIRAALAVVSDRLIETAERGEALTYAQMVGLAEHLIELREETYRHRKGRRPNASERMTPEMRVRIFEEWFAAPTDTMQRIGERLNVNSGRVFETLFGFRT